MTSAADQALRCETAFLAGVDAKLEAAKGSQLRGTIWQRAAYDESQRVKDLMETRRMYSRELQKSLPANRRLALHGFERRLLFWKKRTGVAVASTLSPLAHYVGGAGAPAPRIELGELMDHVRGLISDPRVPHLIGVCSPSGFTDEARTAKLDLPAATLVLIEPTSGGGWRVSCGEENVDRRVLTLFDPEILEDKLARVRQYVEDRSADLLTGSLSASVVAREMGLIEPLVRSAFEQVAAADPELKLSNQDGAWLLFRGAPALLEETKPVSMIERIKQLFSREGDEVEKINVLSERRAGLAQRRDRIYADIAKLETKEADLFAEGKAATSDVRRRRVAAQLSPLRKDLARHNTTAKMLSQQMDIISTDIHNLTLIQQGERAQLPDAAELTENAVKAEEMLETLKSDADLVGSLETSLADVVTSDDELAILREFAGADEVPSDAAVTRPAEATPDQAAKPIERATPDQVDRASERAITDPSPEPETPDRAQTPPEG